MTTPAKTTAELSAHPLSELFPRMDAEELDSLGEDIKANGLKEAIWLFEDKILDGNNRYSAGLKIGYRFKETDFRQFDPKVQGDPLAFVVSQNLHRRHLTESQRATIAATLVTTKLGFNQYTRTGVTNEQAAKMLGVSVAIVKMAKDVAAKATPQIKEQVQKGELRLAAAKQIIKKPKEEQQAELERVKAEAQKRKDDAKAKRDAAKAGKPTTSKEPKTNQAMKDVDDFKAKWQGFTDVQRRAFVMMLKDELAAILDDVRQQEEILGAKAA
jgi:transposase